MYINQNDYELDQRSNILSLVVGIIKIITMSAFLQLVGIFIAILIYWLTSYHFGVIVHKYPFNHIVIVDFLFIVISAVLGQIAEGSAAGREQSNKSPSLELTGFLICVGTLAPLATYTSGVLFNIYETGILQKDHSTVLSLMVCPSFEKHCSNVYLSTIACILVFALIMSLLNAILIRTIVSKSALTFQEARYHVGKYSLFFSACGFSVYSLLLQPWTDFQVNIPDASSINFWFAINRILTLTAVFSIVLCCMIILAQNAARLTVSGLMSSGSR